VTIKPSPERAQVLHQAAAGSHPVARSRWDRSLRRIRPAARRRALSAVRWSRSVATSGWEYLSRTRKVRRSEGPGSVPDDLPAPLPSNIALGELQDVADGVGPLLHRCYVARVRAAELTAAQLIGAFAGRPNCASPQQLADFDKVHGAYGELRVGDEFTIQIPGPWDGPVRVVEVDSNGFGFVTLDGHLEAGRIRFSARDLAPGCLELRIEAWARGGDHVSNMLFDRIGINKEIQLHTWTSVLARLLQLAKGRRDGPIYATTKRVDAADIDARSTATSS
jgi:hypothetical protein